MTIIDLLNKIAFGEETPNKFKYDKLTFVKDNEGVHYDEYGDNIKNSIAYDLSNLDDEIEIIEEDNKIEKISINDNGTLGFPNGQWAARNMDKGFAFKINELIDKVNNMEDNK